jgi:lysophospholipase L1-like esterase
MKRRPSRVVLWATLGTIAFGILAIGFGMAELYMRRAGLYRSYAERVGLRHIPIFDEKVLEPWAWISPPAHVSTNRGEFVYRVDVNSDGLNGPELQIKKESREFRIIAVGDSFTRGIGAKWEEAYPEVLEKDLNGARDRHIRVINAGVAGSDPAFELELLKRRLMKFHPDLVILSINSTDVHEFIWRGGLDRFPPDGRWHAQGPWFAPLFDSSRVIRAFCMEVLGYDWKLHRNSERAQEEKTAIAGLIESASRLAAFSREQRIRYLIAVHTSPQEMELQRISTQMGAVDQGLNDRGLAFVDVSQKMFSELNEPFSRQYYWPIDGHFNAKGYAMFARIVARELRSRHLLP